MHVPFSPKMPTHVVKLTSLDRTLLPDFQVSWKSGRTDLSRAVEYMNRLNPRQTVETLVSSSSGCLISSLTTVTYQYTFSLRAENLMIRDLDKVEFRP